MSKAYKCDRCGKLYEAKERTLEFKEHAVLKPHTINYEIGNPGTYLCYVADLFPECQKQLEMWMKGTVFEILEEMKGCYNCKYYNSLINTEPCFSCSHAGDYKSWEPKEEEK